jgi:dihydroorotate dehydrogenase
MKYIQIGDKHIPLVMNASGCWVNTPQQVTDISHHLSNCCVAKTCTINPRNANPTPNFIELGTISINSKGLPNLGYQVYRDLWRDLHLKGGTLIMSFDCSNFNDLVIMLSDFNRFVEIAKADIAIERGCGTPDATRELVELNVSCPNKMHSGGRIIGYDLPYLERILAYIKGMGLQHIEVGLKLPPYLDKYVIDSVGCLIMRYSDVVRFVVCCNSVPNAMVFVPVGEAGTPKNALASEVGGMSGVGAKCIALANVRQFGKIFANSAIKLIGCGGVESIFDVKSFLAVGAVGVQVGRALYLNGSEKLIELNAAFNDDFNSENDEKGKNDENLKILKSKL